VKDPENPKKVRDLYSNKSYIARKFDIVAHVNKEKHKKNKEKLLEMKSFMKSCNTKYLQVARAEMKWSLFVAQENMSFHLA